ncbi:MAG TPA: hypothetical protein VGG82_07790 [Casimicrobiaceae bacterium]|jgi:hypothetical protein
MTACRGCGTTSGEVLWSDAIGDLCCLECLPVLARYAPPSEFVAEPRAPRRIDPYARKVTRVWLAIEERTGQSPFYIDARHIASYCPLCIDGTMLVQFIDGPHPRGRISSVRYGEGYCSLGCPEDDIVRAMIATVGEL